MQLPPAAVYAILAGLCFSASAPFTKLLSPEVPPLMLAALFLLGSAAGTTAYAALAHLCGQKRSSIEAPLTRKDLPWVFAVTLFGSILATLLIVYGVAATTATTAAFLFSFEGAATVLVASILFREAVDRRIWAAVACITFSCMIMSFGGGAERFGFHFSYGAVLILLSCLSWGIANNCIRMISGVDPIYQTLVRSWIGGLILFVLALASGEMLPAFSIVLFAAFVGFISYGGLTSIFFVYGVRDLGSARATTYFSLNPVFGIILSIIIFQTLPGIMLWIALPFLLIGMWLLMTEKHQHLHTHESLIHEHRHRHDDLHHADALHMHTYAHPELDSQGFHSHSHEHGSISHSHIHHPDLHHHHEHSVNRYGKTEG
jgi:drug/metabolite transporter (DMT)-like permease